MLIRVAVVGILALGMLVGSARADASKLAGKYNITGVDGTPFKGTAEVQHKLGNVVIITYHWKNSVWIGLGKLIEGDKLRITYERAKLKEPSDRMIYNVKPNGNLTYNKAGYRETWTKQK